MSRGLSKAQIGVTEAMVESFGETIFRLSHNHQRRRGDPIRLKDFAAIERQRAALGLSDAEISGRIGLSHDQVTFIRNLVERRKIRRNHYQRLLELGGGRRFRAERFTPHEQRRGYSETAMNLRDAMRVSTAPAPPSIWSGVGGRRPIRCHSGSPGRRRKRRTRLRSSATDSVCPTQSWPGEWRRLPGD